MVAYDWRIKGIFKVSAQDAGYELNRIYQKRGELVPRDIVDESRPQDAVLHPCFEWRDDVAAEKYRENQARKICDCIVVTHEREEKPPVQVRAVMHAQGAYHPTQVIVQQKDMYESLYQSALRELESFKKKFAIISDKKGMQAIFAMIDAVINIDG